MSATSTNSWLRGQRKSDLVELAESIGLKSYESLKKSDLETALDEFISDHASRFTSNSKLGGYFNSRSKALGSPVKKEVASAVSTAKDEVDKGLKVAKRRVTKLSEEIMADADSSALIQTPGRSLSQVAARIPLPATPADMAHVVDRSTLAMRKRVSSMYQESGITEATTTTRETLSTVTSVLFCVSAFELYHIAGEVLPKRYAFTVPAVAFLGTSDWPVYVSDMFLLLTASFWSPALTWALTSTVLPCLFGYFFNLMGASSSGPKTRSRAHLTETVVDPLTFSIVKALLSFVVYGQGATFYGLLSETSIERLNGAVYGGYKGALVGTAITALVSMYDAALRK